MAHTLRAFRKDMTDAQFYNEGIEKVSNDCLMRLLSGPSGLRKPGASSCSLLAVCTYALVSMSCA